MKKRSRGRSIEPYNSDDRGKTKNTSSRAQRAEKTSLPGGAEKPEAASKRILVFASDANTERILEFASEANNVVELW